MGDIKPIVPEGANVVGPYSPAARAGDFLFVSGQIALGPEGELVQGDVAEEARRCLENLKQVLRAAGADLSDLVKVTIYLTDMGDFQAVNRVYADYLGGHRPARATVAVAALPRGARVEIEAIAYLKRG